MAEDYEFKPEKSENNTNSVLFVIVDAFEGIRINKLASNLNSTYYSYPWNIHFNTLHIHDFEQYIA